MARRSARRSLRETARQVAAPLWEQVGGDKLDRFFIERLLRALLRRFREDRFARVKEGGIHGDARTELSRVFIDLDVARSAAPHPGEPASERIVASWMRAEEPARPRNRGMDRNPHLPMDVVLGGPGQGKSTVARFLTLIHASILLLSAPIPAIASPADVRNMETLLGGLEAEGIPFPGQVRLPIWIELRELAAALGRDGDESDPLEATLRFWAKAELREPTDVASLEDALDELPWVMVLDGLDEVPIEGGRAKVGALVADLQARFIHSDGWLIGSSRPQGYDPEVFRGAAQKRLLDLTPERAATYGSRLAASLHAEEESQRDHLATRMEQALQRPETAALMRSPLQVTIIATIIVHHGEPASRRWLLFKDYYETIYRRETARGTWASALLRDHPDLLHAMHAHVGMSLHARAEKGEGVEALMPEHELRALLRERLLRSYSEDEAVKLSADLLRAAEQRLVLLIQPREGMYGFELRSFQEFMAAWQITSLRDTQIEALLTRLGPLGAWRNVVLFALGALWANCSALSWDSTVGLCERLDDGEAASRLTLPGATLALSILEDSPFGRATKPRDALVARALETLRLPPFRAHMGLTSTLWDVAPERLLEALSRGVNDSATADAAWAVLLGLPAEPGVVEVLERAWPDDRARQRAIVRAQFEWMWWSDQLLGGKLRNTWFGDKLAMGPALAIPSHRQFMLGATANARSAWRRELPISYRAKGWGSIESSCVGIARTGMAGVEPDDDRQLRGAWAVSEAAAVLSRNTTAATLAEVLEQLATSWDERHIWDWVVAPAWPLVACLMAAEGPQDLGAIAARLRQGELGDCDRWAGIEAGFGEASPERISLLAKSPDPLRAILVEGVVAPFDTTRGSTVRGWSGGGDIRPALRSLDAARQSATAPWTRRMIAQIQQTFMAFALEPFSAPRSGDWPGVDTLVELVEDAGTYLNLMWARSFEPPITPADWVSIVTRTSVPVAAELRFGSHGDESPTALLAAFCAALGEHPSSTRLHRALVELLRFEAGRVNAPDTAVDPVGDDLDAWLLRAVSGRARLEDAATLARLLVTVDKAWDLTRTLRMLDLHQRSRSLVLPIIEALVAQADAPVELRAAATQLLADKVARAPVGLASPNTWLAAGLPSPPPMAKAEGRTESLGAQIASITIENIRAFPRRFQVDVPPPGGDGQWLLFLGENATGKTTLLRAIAMALASPADAAAVTASLEGASPLRRDETIPGAAMVKTVDGRELGVSVTGAPRSERVLSTNEAATRPFVVGYGCRRGSATSGAGMDNAFGPFRDLDNLFDRSPGLIRASGWLKELQRLSQVNGARSRVIYEAARAALKKILLGAEGVSIDTEVKVHFDDQRVVPLDALSDGYLTTAGWVVDLMARWLKRNEDRKSIPEDFCAVMEGVVLLDEIDLHLHPRWQERVIEDVRSLFPRLTFVVTTHHPLTLRGARKGEVFILADHDETGTISALQKDIPPGTRVDELFTGAWFNRPSAVVDAETRGMLDEHRELILAGAKAGDPKRKALEAELRTRLGRFADTSLERLAANVVAQHLDETVPEPTAEQREQARRKALRYLKKRDSKQG